MANINDFISENGKFYKKLVDNIKDEEFLLKLKIYLVDISKNLSLIDDIELYKLILKSSMKGIYLDGIDSCIISFKNNASLITTALGMKKQFINKGGTYIHADLVYTEDEFEFYNQNGKPQLMHKYNRDLLIRTEENIQFAYCALDINNQKYIYCLDKSDIDKRKKTFKDGSATTFWRDWYKEMAKKTIILYAVKQLPIFDNIFDEGEEYMNNTPKIIQKDDSSIDDINKLLESE